MTLQVAALDVRAKLAKAIETGSVPTRAVPAANELLERLGRPVMIGISGLPGSGKSTLLNLLAGSQVLPDHARLPTTELSYGESPAAVCTLADGSTQAFDHADVHKIADLSPIFVQIKLPLPALTRVSLLEIVAGDKEMEQQRSLKWMAKRSDIAIWCSQAFTGAEHSLWSGMPDTLMDHAFLLLTKADLIRNNNALQDTLEAINTTSADLFRHILPIDTAKAISARRPDGSVDKERMRESGGVALVSAILRTVDMGLQAAMDRAELLLAQSEVASAPDRSDPIAVAPKPVESPAPTRGISPRAAAEAAKVGNLQAKPAVDVAVTGPEQASGLSPKSRKIYQNAVDYLIRESEEISTEIAGLEAGAPARVMAKAVENVQWLSDLLEKADAASDPALDRARDMALDASDLVQLMQMENRDSASIEAVSLMIQLKRELQTELAA